MMKAKGLPGMFRGEAMNTAVYILNRSPTRSLNGKTPYEAWHGERPAVSFFRIFGCIAHVKNMKPHLKKLEDWSTPMIFVGYETGCKAYRVYNPVDGRVGVTRDVVFDEGAQWDWGVEAEGAGNGGKEEFVIQYPEHIEQVVGGEPAGRITAVANSPLAPTTPSVLKTPGAPHSAPAVLSRLTMPSEATISSTPVELVSPPSNFDELLDAEHNDDAPARFRKLDHVLGPESPPGPIPRVLDDGGYCSHQ
jgi:hypothetical protein